MRSDIIPGATFPNYDLPDHTANSPTSRALIPWFSSSAAEASAPRTAARP